MINLENKKNIKIYNTLSKQKEKFEPFSSDEVKMYCCGPTVYDFLHVGNFRGVVFYNFLRNWLEESGYKVNYVYNFTDVDDKIINRANKENTSAKVIAEKYITEFKKDYHALGLQPHSSTPKVTEHIDSIIELVSKLIEKEKAYVVEGEVLYSVRTFEDYGKLSGRKIDEMEAGTRVEVDPKKKDPLDFALWKPAKEGEQGWDSPWGAGRPGWHIECSSMILESLGEQIDIHGGGLDLVFPHHENEIAQTEGCTGSHSVKYWVHNNMFEFGGAKMSKSLGNVKTMRSFLEEYNGEIFKYLVHASHYRSVTEFSPVTIHQAIASLAKFYSSLAIAESFLADGASDAEEPEDFISVLDKANEEIINSFNDDFNTAKALASFFEVLRFFNGKVKRGVKATAKIKGYSSLLIQFFAKYGKTMALFQEPPKEFLITLDDMLLRQKKLERETIDKLVEDRIKAREAKDWDKSDEIRDQLKNLGIAVQDLPSGSYWEVTK